MPDNPTLPSFPQRFDTIIRGGTIVDGTGDPIYTSDLGIVGDRIAFVGSIPSDVAAGRTIDAADSYVCPGFIDMHTHSDISVLYTPGMDSSLAQGVTTEVVGNCGFSLGLATGEDQFSLERRGLERAGLKLDWDGFPGFFSRIENEGISINIASLAGHGTLRKRVMGLANRPPDARELAEMQRQLAAAMAAGVVGLSSGLEYVPGMYADVAELTALAKVAAEAGGFYATHLRDEGDFLLEAVQEALAVAEGAGLPLQLSHHKAERRQNWGKIIDTLAMVDAAEARGVDVLLDQYPYTAYQTGLSTIALPTWAMNGSSAALAKTLSDSETRAKVRASMPDLDWNAVEIAINPAHREQQGRTVASLAADRSQDPCDWLLDQFSEVTDSFIAAVHFAISETDVERVMRDPRVMIGSDAVATSPEGRNLEDRPHPRSYGTFARVLSRYVREKGVLSWPDAVRKMTSLPASRLGLKDRGQIAAGNVADLVILSPSAIEDTATFTAPHSLARGVQTVLVAGVVALADGVATGTRTGRILVH